MQGLSRGFLLNRLQSVFRTIAPINILQDKFAAYKIFKKLRVQMLIRTIVSIAR